MFGGRASLFERLAGVYDNALIERRHIVARGPYRFVNHPNYLVVAAEIALLPLVFGLWQVALIFSVLNAALLAVRIRAENRALGRSL